MTFRGEPRALFGMINVVHAIKRDGKVVLFLPIVFLLGSQMCSAHPGSVPAPCVGAADCDPLVLLPAWGQLQAHQLLLSDDIFTS